MEPVAHTSEKKTGLRRARREDIHALLPLTAGPMVGRVRALRRLLKTLVADVYVRHSDETITGCVAIVYRRSLQHGGLVATIDLLLNIDESQADAQGRDELLDLALFRARRRGCVAIDCATDDAELARAIAKRGFQPGGTQFIASLRKETTE